MLTLLLASVFGVVEQPSMARAFAVAYRDVISIPDSQRSGTRYLYIGSEEQAKWGDFYNGLSWHNNERSRQPDIVRPRIVTPWLLAIHLDEYGWKATTWEKLAEADNFFHLQLIEKTKGKEDVKRSVPARWVTRTPVEKQIVANLEEATGSKVPIVNGAWFFWQTAIQERRTVGYYDLLNIQDLADYNALVGFDAKILKQFPIEQRKAVYPSGVAEHPRRVDRRGKIKGGYYFTTDFKNPLLKKNPLLILDGGVEAVEGDAHEYIAHSPNGTLAWFLTDGKGKRQNAAPSFVGHDKTTYNNHADIDIGLSCQRCHGPNAGINPIADESDWVKNVFSNELILGTLEYAKLRELQQLYNIADDKNLVFRDSLEEDMEADRAIYTRAVKRANGLTPQQNAELIADLWRIIDGPVNLDRGARYLETTPDKLVNALKGHVKRGAKLPFAPQGLDTVLAMYLAKKPLPVPWEVFQEFYSTARFIIEEDG